MCILANLIVRLPAVAAAIAAALLVCAVPAQAWTFKTLHSFGLNGYGATSVHADKETGKLYVTTDGNPGSGNDRYGSIFEFDPDGTEKRLYAFTGGADGSYPVGRLVDDGNGNFYGTAEFDGDLNCGSCGVIYKITRKGSFKVLHTFLGGADDGSRPIAGLTHDPAGNLYGTTSVGGASGKGTVFRLAADGSFTLLYSFAGGADGSYPSANVTLDDAGNIYGSTQYGGDAHCNCGTIFKLSPSGQ